MQKPSIYSQARDTIRARCKDIIEYYFSSAGAEWKNGEFWTLCPYRADNSIGSFSINGKTGAWSDFSGDTETDKGDIIDLLGLVNGLGKKSREAAEMVVRDFGICQPVTTEHPAANTEHEILITTPPDDFRVPEFKTEPDYITEYVPGFVVARWDTNDGKTIRPYTYTPEGWVSKRPTGWLPLAPYDKTQPVIIVEGEKCYHAGQSAGINVTTWHGGAQSVKRVDFSGMEGAESVIWPDNDEPGMQAADYITGKLKAVGAAKISRVIPSPDWPKKYDIADNGEPGRVIADARVVWPVDAEPVKLQEGFQGYTNLEKSPDAEKVDAIIELVRERAGKPKGDISGFAHIRHLIDLDYDFRWLARYDEAKRSVVFSDEYRTIDDVYIAVLNRCADYGISISPQTRRDIVDTIVSRPENRFNSILDLLNMLESEYSENDTETLLDEWMSHFILPDNSYAHHKEIWRLWFTKTLAHLHGAFTKYDQIPADIVPVLVGGQGIGKSTLCRALAISPNEYFVDMGDKAGKELGTAESMRLISGKIVAELGEMISIRKSEIETVKSFISATADHLRQLYKEGITELPRTASFIGTSNPDQFLVDVTGNRRFFPLKIVAIDPWLTASKEGLELIKKLYAAFSRIGRGLIEQGKLAVMAACRPTRELEDWISGARDMATDAPVIVEKIIQATHDMEQAFKDAGGFPTGPGRKQDYMKFSAVLIAQEIFGYGNESKADRNFGRWCDKVLTDMGYERSVIKIGACTQRGWKKHLDKIVIDTKRHEQEKIQEQLQHANT